jgi:hypothetical protein
MLGARRAAYAFKYERHTEILKGGWVDCSATLNADSEPYAAFPRGIPQGTSFA